MNKTNFIYPALFVLTTPILIIASSIVFFITAFVIGLVVYRIFSGIASTGVETAFAVGLLLGYASLPFSFIPSYKLSLKLAKNLQSRGWEIKNPKKLFFISIGLLFLPIILLVLLGLL